MLAGKYRRIVNSVLADYELVALVMCTPMLRSARGTDAHPVQSSDTMRGRPGCRRRRRSRFSTASVLKLTVYRRRHGIVTCDGKCKLDTTDSRRCIHHSPTRKAPMSALLPKPSALSEVNRGSMILCSRKISACHCMYAESSSNDPVLRG